MKLLAPPDGRLADCHGAPVVCGDAGPSLGKVVGFLRVTNRGKRQRPTAQVHLLTEEALKLLGSKP